MKTFAYRCVFIGFFKHENEKRVTLHILSYVDIKQTLKDVVVESTIFVELLY